MQTLIGIYSSAPCSGKTTAAKFLASEKRFLRFSFADSVKFTAINLLVNIGMKEHEAHDLVFFRKEEQIPVLRQGVTARCLLQKLGTDFGRNLIDPDIWIKGWKYEINAQTLDVDNVVVDDVRFENEFSAIREMGGKMWFVRRPVELLPEHVYESALHESEGMLDNAQFDCIIDNDGSLEDLHKKVELAIAEA